MSLVIEDGSIVANANSYVTLEEARSYASARGKDLPVVDSDLEALLILAMDYLEAQRSRYQGTKVSELQELQFPRNEVLIDGFYIDATAIPKLLKQAQIRLAMEGNEGVDLQPTTTGPFIIHDETGPLITKYSEKIGTSNTPEMQAVEALLKPLYSDSIGSSFLTTIRV